MKAGVVENMAPLGTLPKAAAMGKKSAVHGDHSPGSATQGVRKIVLKPKRPSAEVTAPIAVAGESITTPPLLPGVSPEFEDADVMMLSPSSRSFILPVVDDGEDEDYVPKKPSSKTRHSSFTPTLKSNSHPTHIQNTSVTGVNATANRRQSSRRKSARPSPPPPSSPIPSAVSVSVSVSASPSRIQPPLPPPPPPPPINPSRIAEDRQLADKVVEQAVEQAIEHCRYPTAYALRDLYDERCNDPHFVSMLVNIFHQRADTATLREFNRIILEKKRYGKRQNYAFEYFVPDEIPIPKPKPAPYASLVSMDLSVFKEVAPDADGRATKKIKVEKDSETPPRPSANASANANVNVNLDVHANANADAKADAKTGISAVNGISALGLNGNTTILTMNSVFNPATAFTTVAAVAPIPAVVLAPAPATPAATPAPAVVGTTAATTTITTRPNGIKNTRSPRGKKRRSGSVSSTSSLSSVPDDIPDDYDEFMDQVDDDLAVSRPRSAEGNDTPNPAGPGQPISASHKKSATKKKNVSPKPATHPSTTNYTISNPSDSRMPAAVAANGTSHHHQTGQTQTPAPLKFASKYGDLESASKGLTNSKTEKRAENRRLTGAASVDSFIRDGVVLSDGPGREDMLPALPLPTVTAPAEQPRLSRTPALSSRAARAAKRNHDEVDDLSPTTASFQAAFEPSSSRRNSRAATPSNLRSAKKPRGGLRVKTS